MIRFIETSGNIAFEAPFSSHFGTFSEGFSQVVYSQFYVGFINKIGELVIETPFVEARNFSEGLAIVKTVEKGFYFQSETRWGAINKVGQIVFETVLDKLYDFSEGVAVGQSKDEFYFLDKQGEIIHSFNTGNYYLDLNGSKRFSEGLIAVVDAATNKFGFMNKEGKIVIKPQFENAANFAEGLARVSIKANQREYLGFINTTGDFVIEPKFDIDSDFLRCSNDFSEGLASLLNGPLLMDREQNFIFIDSSGEIIINTEFFRAEGFHDGLALVWDEHSEKYGYIDKSGNLAIPLIYDYARDFSEGLAQVS